MRRRKPQSPSTPEPEPTVEVVTDGQAAPLNEAALVRATASLLRSLDRRLMDDEVRREGRPMGGAERRTRPWREEVMADHKKAIVAAACAFLRRWSAAS